MHCNTIVSKLFTLLLQVVTTEYKMIDVIVLAVERM